jgi:hypothetical protein
MIAWIFQSTLESALFLMAQTRSPNVIEDACPGHAVPPLWVLADQGKKRHVHCFSKRVIYFLARREARSPHGINGLLTEGRDFPRVGVLLVRDHTEVLGNETE